MATFPKLKTGAVAQYPSERHVGFSTQVLEFVDGSEQRFREYRKPLRKWVVRFELLDEGEVAALRSFFDQAGAASPFAFTDPWDGTLYPNCTVDGDDFEVQYMAAGRVKTELTIRENRT